MPNKFWTLTGKLLKNTLGKLLYCENCPCDEISCNIATDNFNSPSLASSSGVSDWNIIDGIWEVSNNELQLSSNGVVNFETPHPDAEPEQKVTVNIRGNTAGDKIKVIVNFTDDDNYLFVQVELGASCGTLSLWERSSGTETQLGSDVGVEATVDDVHKLEVYYTDDKLGAVFTPNSGTTVTYRKAATSQGSKVGLGGIVTGTIAFDNFIFEKAESTVNTNCPNISTACLVHQDTFNRSDSSDLGCFWDEVSGAWEISTNELHNTSDGIVISKLPQTNGESSQNVQVTGIDFNATDGSKARVIVDYLDEDNYHYGELEFNSGAGNSVVRAFKVTGGTHTQIGSDDPCTSATPNDLHVCFDGTYIEVIGNGGKVEQTTTSHGGDRVGVGSDSGTDMKFDTFTFNRLRGENDLLCGDCVTTGTCNNCIDNIQSDLYKVVIAGMPGANCCGNYNGTHLAARIGSPTCVNQKCPFPTVFGGCLLSDLLEIYFGVNYRVFIPNTGPTGHPSETPAGKITLFVMIQLHNSSCAICDNLIGDCQKIWWMKHYDDPPGIDCLELVNEDIPYDSIATFDWCPLGASVPTCKVTAV